MFWMWQRNFIGSDLSVLLVQLGTLTFASVELLTFWMKGLWLLMSIGRATGCRRCREINYKMALNSLANKANKINS